MKGKERATKKMTKGTTNRGGKGRMNNKAKRLWWSRLVAGLLCLCMVVTGTWPTMSAHAEEQPDMQVLVYHWRSGNAAGEKDEIQSKPLSASERERSIHPVPDTENGEYFTAFSITAGQSAVTKIDYDTPEATITYDAHVPLVKIDIFYTGGGDSVVGKEFGRDIEENNPEIDTKYDKDLSTTVYDTSTGLHTNKVVSALSDESADATGTRMFDVTLESWFTGENKANVGMILDSSGSMSWTSKDIEEPKSFYSEDLEAAGVSEEDLKKEESIWLTDENVARLLDVTKTDNSLLGHLSMIFSAKWQNFCVGKTPMPMPV